MLEFEILKIMKLKIFFNIKIQIIKYIYNLLNFIIIYLFNKKKSKNIFIIIISLIYNISFHKFVL